MMCTNIVVRNQLQLFILHIETHTFANIYLYVLSVEQRAVNKSANECVSLCGCMCEEGREKERIVSERDRLKMKKDLKASNKWGSVTEPSAFAAEHWSPSLACWHYHYKLHGINIHLPIYSMSCGSNTIQCVIVTVHPVQLGWHCCCCIHNNCVGIEKSSLFSDAMNLHDTLSHLIYPHVRCTYWPFNKSIWNFVLVISMGGRGWVREKWENNPASGWYKQSAYVTMNKKAFYQCRRLAKQ